MLGVSHIVVNTVSMVGLIDASFALYKFTQTHAFFGPRRNIISNLWNGFISYFVPYSFMSQTFWIWFVSVAFLFLLGTLLPDIDSKKSILGRIMHIPVEHRTWTHTIWIPLLFFIGSIWWSVLFYVGAGYMLHLFWDNLSVCGVCYFYPITKYRKYGSSGARVKKNHRIKLYHTGKASEGYVVGVFMALISVASFFTAVYWYDIPLFS